MPELMDGAYIFGFLAAILSRVIGNRSDAGRRLPLWGTVLIAVAAAYVGPPAFAWLQVVWRATPFLPEVTTGMVFIGGWVAFIALTMFERKGQPRRVPIWAGVLVSVVAALALPPVIDRLTGAYQNASLRADVNRCTRGMLADAQPRRVTNICDFPITVGLCLPGELNPAPCVQSVMLAPGAVADFDPGEARLSTRPSNENGLTVVACRPPHRPSRTIDPGGRKHVGVCLPKGG